MRDEYDFSGGVRGKHFRAYSQGTNLVLLDPDVAEAFPDAVAVNQALRMLVQLAKRQVPSGDESCGRRGLRRYSVSPTQLSLST